MLVLLSLMLACIDSGESIPAAAPEPTGARTCPTGRPDVVIASVDTTRADRLGFMGLATANTPTLDGLAAAGHVFTGAIAPVPRTTPALASLMTGLAPHHHGAREVGEVVNAEITLATLLKAAGWQTVGISSMPVAGPDQNMDRGFDHFEVDFAAPADQLTARALKATSTLDTDCPLFLWTHYSDPHFPYNPPREHPRPEASKCQAVVDKAEAGKLARYKYYENRDGRAEAIVDECRALYDAEITHADRSIGALLEGLRAQGRSAPLVIFTADHGENLGEWGLFFEHGPNAHDASLRVPLVISGPGVEPGRTTDVSSLQDVLPTILGRLDLSVPAGLDGLDLFSGTPRRWVKAESGSALHARLGGYLVAGRKKRLHCIHAEQYSLCSHPKQPTQLFNRRADPDLRKDVSAAHPEVVAALSAAWERWPVERTRQRVVRTNTHMLVATPALEGGYTLALYNHAEDSLLGRDLSGEDVATMRDLAPVMEQWHRELDGASQDVRDKSEDEEQALRALGYIE